MAVRVLFVCWANACRSPMAHALCEGLARERGLAVEVDSAAGVEPARETSPEAVDAVASLRPGWEGTIRRRRPRSIHDVRGEPELVVVLSRSALDHARERFPHSRVVALPVKDPIGRGQGAYDACAAELLELCGELLDDIERGRLP